MLAIRNTVYEVVEAPKYITMYESYQNREKRMKRAEQRYKLIDVVLNLPPEEVFF